MAACIDLIGYLDALLDPSASSRAREEAVLAERFGLRHVFIDVPNPSDTRCA